MRFSRHTRLRLKQNANQSADLSNLFARDTSLRMTQLVTFILEAYLENEFACIRLNSGSIEEAMHLGEAAPTIRICAPESGSNQHRVQFSARRARTCSNAIERCHVDEHMPPNAGVSLRFLFVAMERLRILLSSQLATELGRETPPSYLDLWLEVDTERGVSVVGVKSVIQLLSPRPLAIEASAVAMRASGEWAQVEKLGRTLCGI